MRKLLIWILFAVASMNLFAADTIILTEDFNTGLNWTATGVNLFVHETATPGLDATGYANLPPWLATNNLREGWLTSPVFDASGYSNLNISFDHRLICDGPSTQGSVEYSLDGINWVQVYVQAVSIGDWSAPDQANALIPASGATMQVRFFGELRGKTASQWSIDNVVIFDHPLVPDVPTPGTPIDGASLIDFTPTFDWNDVAGSTSYTILVDNNADFSSPEVNQSPTLSTFTPGTDLAAGTYYWKILATNSEGSSEYSLPLTFNLGSIPTAPSGTFSPADGGNTSDTTPFFDWDDVPGATSYTITIDNNSDFSSPEDTGTPTLSEYTATDLAPGTYFWTVTAVNEFGESIGSTVISFTVGSVPAAPTGVFTPADGTNTTDTTPFFDWEDVPGATSYIIYVDDNADVLSPEVTGTPTLSEYTATDLAPGTYYWTVIAVNEFGESIGSTIISYTIGSEPVAPSGTFSPADGGNTSDTTPFFDWDDVPGATSYTITIDNNSDFSSPEDTGTPTLSEYTATDLAPGTYFWTVTAVNEFGESIGSTVISFTVGSVPAAPTGVFTPADGTNTTDTTPFFDWEDVPGATSYIIYVDDNADVLSPEVTGTPTLSEYTATDLAPGTYYWTVIAVNEFGESIGSTIISYTIGSEPVAPSGTFSPADGGNTSDTTPFFDWDDVPGATSYTITIDDNSDFSSPEDAGTPTLSEYTATDLAPGTYYWTVTAVNEFGESIGSTVISFTVDQTPPAAPLNVITNDSGSDVIVSWEAVSGAVSYNLYTSDDPYGTFVFEANVTVISYQVLATESKKFWYVTAVN